MAAKAIGRHAVLVLDVEYVCYVHYNVMYSYKTLMVE